MTRAHGDLSDRIGRPVDRGQLCAIDPRTRVIVLQLYESLLKCIPLSAGTGAVEDAFNVRCVAMRVLFDLGKTKIYYFVIHGTSSG